MANQLDLFPNENAPAATCFYCDSPPGRYCDFVLGLSPAPRSGKFRNGTSGLSALSIPRTCDLALCLEHRTQVGVIHINARRPLGGFDTIDHCLEHAGQPDAMLTNMSLDEAETLRRAVRAAARRRIMRDLNRKTHSN